MEIPRRRRLRWVHVAVFAVGVTAGLISWLCILHYSKDRHRDFDGASARHQMPVTTESSASRPGGSSSEAPSTANPSLGTAMTAASDSTFLEDSNSSESTTSSVGVDLTGLFKSLLSYDERFNRSNESKRLHGQIVERLANFSGFATEPGEPIEAAWVVSKLFYGSCWSNNTEFGIVWSELMADVARHSDHVFRTDSQELSELERQQLADIMNKWVVIANDTATSINSDFGITPELPFEDSAFDLALAERKRRYEEFLPEILVELEESVGDDAWSRLREFMSFCQIIEY